MKIVKVRFNKTFIGSDKKEHYCTAYAIHNGTNKLVLIKPINNDDYKLLNYLCEGFIDYVKKED